MKIHSKLLHTAFSCALTVGACVSSVQAADLNLSTIPLFIKDGVDPNLIITLDDSGSMGRAHAPDAMYSDRSKKYYKSSDYNPMYYNPNVTYTPPQKADGTSYTTTFNAAWHDGFTHRSGNGSTTVDLRSKYRVTREWRTNWSNQTWADSTERAAYYYKYDESDSSCSKSKTDEDCYTKVTMTSSSITNAQRQNFANWYSFYRTRLLATVSAASLAFQTIDKDTRVAWQNLSWCTSFDTSDSNDCEDYKGNTYDNHVRPFASPHRESFYKWLKYAPANGGTPLRKAIHRAGELLKVTTDESPYAKKPGTTLAPLYECRASYHIAMTDGIWNGSRPDSSGYNYDNVKQETPGGFIDNGTPKTDFYKRKYGKKTYDKFTPYKDSQKETVADLVFNQWITDARTDIANKVPPYVPFKNDDEDKEYWDARNDPAEWQHMTTFMVGLGLTTTLTNPNYTLNGGTFGGDYDKLVDGTKSWPAATDNDANNNPYDLWHAAINGRGEFFGVEDPNSLVSAFAKIIAGIQERNASAASTALDSGIVNGLEYAYHAKFFSADWSGDLQAFELIPPHYVPAATNTWSARDQLAQQSASSRKITFVGKSGGLEDFLWGNATKAQQDLLDLDTDNNVDSLGEDRVAYLRGDSSKDGSVFRARGKTTISKTQYTKVLGDIVHSSPAYVGKPGREGYDKLENITVDTSAVPAVIPSNSYYKFKSDHANRKELVFVGANDGMLHAFDAATGNEHFAFIPSEVFPKLRELTYKDYIHQYYVDGAIATGDVYDTGAAKEWKSILVSSLRAGGKSVSALDVTKTTDPNDIKLLWEFTDTDLGYTYNKPQIVRLHNNRWGVLISNGYNSTNHTANLFVLDAITGAVIKKFETGVGSAASPNGLAEPSPVDINGDLIIDYVYAGDLQGNVWRFDLIDTSKDPAIHEDTATVGAKHPRENADANTWSIAYGGNPLFTAKDDATPANRQPITTNFVVAPHSYGEGVMVMFGTGKYLEASDAAPDTAHTQSYYGIWDRNILGEATNSSTLSTAITRANLTEQTLSIETTDIYKRTESDGSVSEETETTRVLSQNEVEWFDYTTTPPTLKKQGWYVDFENAGTDIGELLATESVIIGNVVSFATTIPNINPCDPGVDRWIWAVDIMTGGRTKNAVFDLNNDKTVDDADVANSTVSNSVKTEGMGAVSAVGETIYLNQESSVEALKTNPQGSNLRRSWRTIR